jgi:RNA polymerase sigma-70 factor (ECF subfamily)
VKELSQKEVAARLGLTEKTVEKHLTAAVRKLAHYMRKEALTSGTLPRDAHEVENDEASREHGSHERD